MAQCTGMWPANPKAPDNAKGSWGCPWCSAQGSALVQWWLHQIPGVIFSTDCYVRRMVRVSMCTDLCGQKSLCQRIQAQERKGSISWGRINRMLVDLTSRRQSECSRSGLSWQRGRLPKAHTAWNMYSFPAADNKKSPQIWWLKATEMYSLSPESKMSEIRVSAGPPSIQSCGEWLFSSPLLPSCDCWRSLAYSHITPIFSSVFLHITVYIPLCLCLFCLI